MELDAAHVPLRHARWPHELYPHQRLVQTQPGRRKCRAGTENQYYDTANSRVVPVADGQWHEQLRDTFLFHT